MTDTTYTLQTTDRDEALQAIKAVDTLCFIERWEGLMREAYRYEHGAIHDIIPGVDDIEKLRELWFIIKEEYGVPELI